MAHNELKIPLYFCDKIHALAGELSPVTRFIIWLHDCSLCICCQLLCRVIVDSAEVRENSMILYPKAIPGNSVCGTATVTATAGTLRPPIEDEDFVNAPDNATPEGQVPPLVTPFILPAGSRPNPAVARYFGCGRTNQACCISVLKFGAFGACFRGSICRTERIFPVCEDVDLVGGCAAGGGAVVRGFCSQYLLRIVSFPV